MRRALWVSVGVLLPVLPARAEVDLVTLPARDLVQLTIYNSADLTLVREVRRLTFTRGMNRLAFGWANTLIDPTSLSLRAVERPDAVTLLDVSYPPRIRTQAVWSVRSEIAGPVPVEITYLASGLSWRSFYMGTLSPDEKTLRLAGYVRVENNSGEDYAGAQTRVVVGQVHLLDEIARLARRDTPFGRPGQVRDDKRDRLTRDVRKALEFFAENEEDPGVDADGLRQPKKIRKEGLSEYFLYTIEGTETIPTGWAKRLPSFTQDGIPVVNIYKYDPSRFGDAAVRFLYFRNDKEHKLGETPLPDGTVKIYRTVDGAGHLSYEGADTTKYIPVDEKAELNLGPARNVQVEPTAMEERTENFTFDRDGNISGYDDVKRYRVRLKNLRDLPVRIEVTRDFKHAYWKMEREGDFGTFEKMDLDTVRFTVDLPPHTVRDLHYVRTYYEGERRNRAER